MAPTRAVKLPTKTDSPAHTPTSKSPIKKVFVGITATQKQALIDNLQLEITERARKLRAQYAMQAQGLRTRVELRVNRIPTALRKLTMGELLQKYGEDVKKSSIQTSLQSPRVRPAVMASPSKNLVQQAQSQTRASPSPVRPAKRPSTEVIDKENGPLDFPKKRAKPNDNTSRTTSRTIPESQVLSPRSANSRTLPKSPIKPSPMKSFLARPISPLKPAAPGLVGGASTMLHNMVEKAKTTRTTATRKVTASSSASSNASTARAKKTAAATTATATASRARITRARISDHSQASDASSGTVVTAAKKAPAKRTVMSTIKGAVGKKTAAAKAATKTAAATAAPVSSGRTLRKRT